jgi:hypothetical protein
MPKPYTLSADKRTLILNKAGASARYTKVEGKRTLYTFMETVRVGFRKEPIQFPLVFKV